PALRLRLPPASAARGARAAPSRTRQPLTLLRFVPTPETSASLRRRLSGCQDAVLIIGMEAGSYSQSLERGLAILSAFRSGAPLLGVSELGRDLGLSRSTTHRYVATLAALGYLQQDPGTKKYRLGPRVLDLGFSAINSMELLEIAAPHLRELSDESGFTVNMAILDDLDIVYVERCRSAQARQREIDLNLHVGSRLPAYCTSLGKVLFAYLDAADLDARLRRIEFARRGPNTLTSRRSLEAELERVRENGYAVNNEELAYGLRSIAAPILTHDGAAPAAINLAVHSSMVSSLDMGAKLGPVVRRAAADVSARLGYRPA